MTIIRKYDVPSKRFGMKKPITCIELKCDTCAKVWTVHRTKQPLQKQFHSCSRACAAAQRRKGGFIHEKHRKACIERYGVENPMQSDNVKAKMQQTMVKRYGVKNPQQDPEIRASTQQTMLERYGVEHPMQSDEIKMRTKETCIERYGVENPMQALTTQEKSRHTCIKKYGVEHPMQSDEIHAKARQTMLERYGTKYSMQSDEIRERIRLTCQAKYGVDNIFQHDATKERIRRIMLERYGVEHAMQSDEIKMRTKETCIERYGVENPMQSAEIKAKIDFRGIARQRHQTMKQNGTYARQASAAEDSFYAMLCEKFETGSIERHVEVGGLSIDFYVRPIDAYIQFDGVYWHGLDRPLDVIREFKNPRDEVIYNTYLRDREQDTWFEEHGLLLLRVTDMDDPHEFIDTIDGVIRTG